MKLALILLLSSCAFFIKKEPAFCKSSSFRLEQIEEAKQILNKLIEASIASQEWNLKTGTVYHDKIDHKKTISFVTKYLESSEELTAMLAQCKTQKSFLKISNLYRQAK